jgi:predicted regulator of Ras-like GTPase activity (Roadblock/LC7/MglB family)
VTGAAIVSAEGFTAASLLSREVDEEVVAGMAAALLGMAKRAAEELLQGDMQQAFVKSANGYVILNSLGADAVLVVLANENAKLGLVLFEVERCLPELSTLL